VNDTAALETLQKGFDGHVAAVCGLTVVDHLHFGGIVPGITATSVRAVLNSVRRSVSKAFYPALSEIN
jgi:NAD(P)H dehydrogenase (quinone)